MTGRLVPPGAARPRAVRTAWPLLALCLLHTAPAALPAQEKADSGLLTIDRIFQSSDFTEDSFGPVRWLEHSPGFTTLEPSKSAKGHQDVVRHDLETGDKEVLVPAADLIPEGDTTPLSIDAYHWSPNEGLVLIFTNTRRVWRLNTRGDYWVYDITSRELRKLGGDAPPASLMFAKFSPDSKKVAYVRDRNIYVEDLLSRKIRRLTEGGEHTINGTFDWVYEEELGLHDGFRWSPDSSKIAYWQLDTSGVGDYYIVDNIAGLYQKLHKFQYPKAGTKNPAARVGVVAAAEPAAVVKAVGGLVDSGGGGNGEGRAVPPTVWMKLPGDPREHYIARMDWAGDSNEIVLQQFNRLQNTNKAFLGDVSDGSVRNVLTEQDKAWVDVHDHLTWLGDGAKFLWLSERDGWNHAYVVSRSGVEINRITPGDYDVIDVAAVDGKGGWLYYTASPKNATQKYLFRAALDGTKQEQLTPEDQPGTHEYDISPDAKWAVHTYSTFDTPPVKTLIQLPGHEVVRTLADNKKLREKVNALKRVPTEFFQVDIDDNVKLDGWVMKPFDFDPAKRYPVLFYVYGEPAGQTVLDSWSGSRYLWHLMLTQKGYVVMSVDNRGTPAPKGRDWRKYIYRRLGVVAPKDQAAAVKAIENRWRWVDPQRVGIWGWSGGGSMSLHAIFRYPDLYKTAMSVAPVSNERYYDTIYEERYMGLPQDNVQGYRDGSPITYAHGLQGNLLLVHGTADDNVHYANAEAVVDELIRHNRFFTMMAYPNRTHSIREGRNTRRHLYTLLTRYLEVNLPAGPQ